MCLHDRIHYSRGLPAVTTRIFEIASIASYSLNVWGTDVPTPTPNSLPSIVRVEKDPLTPPGPSLVSLINQSVER